MRRNRRGFIQTLSAVSAAGFIGARWPRRWRAATPAELLAQAGAVMLDEAALRAIGHRAIDAAKSAGATYADARVELGYGLNTMVGTTLASSGPGVNSMALLAVRAIQRGGCGLAMSNALDADAVVRTAELAVARARTAALGVSSKPYTLAPAPVVPNGRWEPAVEIDPFNVPFGRIEAFLADAGKPVLDIVKPLVASRLAGLYCSVSFGRSESVFASTEGSTIWQRAPEFDVGASVRAWTEAPHFLDLTKGTNGIPRGRYGFEGLERSDLKAKWVAAAEQVMRDSTLPVRNAEVGQCDMVLGAPLVASLLAATIGQALRLDRARGDLADAEGTSYAAPPDKILGGYHLGPLLTITADRTRPRASGTVGWDDDGVAPDEFVLVQDGVVMDYITTRETALDLAPWYRRQNRPVRSHGCAARVSQYLMGTTLPNFALRPGTAAISADDLIADTKRGVYAASADVNVDQQLLNVMVGSSYAPVYQVVNGKITALMKAAGFLFNTPQFWKQLDVIGGPAAVSRQYIGGSDSEILAPPARARQLSTISYGKEA